MSLINILGIIFILMLIGVFPTWSYSQNWGYGPSGGIGIVVLVIVLFLLFGGRSNPN